MSRRHFLLDTCRGYMPGENEGVTDLCSHLKSPQFPTDKQESSPLAQSAQQVQPYPSVQLRSRSIMPSKLKGSEMPSSRPRFNKECVERLYHPSYLLLQSDR